MVNKHKKEIDDKLPAVRSHQFLTLSMEGTSFIR